jgi:hypothetical protein
VRSVAGNIPAATLLLLAMPAFHAISGREMIRKFGCKACPK